MTSAYRHYVVFPNPNQMHAVVKGLLRSATLSAEFAAAINAKTVFDLDSEKASGYFYSVMKLCPNEILFILTRERAMCSNLPSACSVTLNCF